MIKGYKQQILNGQALQRLTKPIYKPSINLNVEEYDEYRGHYRMTKHFQRKAPAVIMPDPSRTPYEKVSANLQNDTISQDSFSKSDFFGNPIMGI